MSSATPRKSILYLWTPAGMMLAVSFISYLDRNTLALLAPTVLAETGLTQMQYGFVISAFATAYMLGCPAWGFWLDRIGLRFGMAVAVAAWTLASVSHAFVSGFWGFASARAALGFGEGATFPGGLRAVTQTLPETLRSRGLALAYSGGSLGAIVTPLLVTPIAVTWGWRAAFWCTGLVGLCWMLAWVGVSRRPDVREVKTPQALGLKALSWSDTRVWGFVAIYAAGALPLGFILYVAALYLGQVRGLSQAELGAYLWIPPLGWEVGYFVWGWLCDRWRLGVGNTCRFGPAMGLLVVLSFATALVPKAAGLATAIALMFVSMFAASGFVIFGLRYGLMVSGEQHASLIAGLGAGGWSALVALTMPEFGRLFDLRLYDEAFIAAALFPAAGYLVWRGLDLTAQAAGRGSTTA